MALETKQSSRQATPVPVLRHHRVWMHRLPLWSRRSIRARLQLSHLVTSLVPLFMLGFALLYTSAQAERRVVEQTQLSVAASIARDLGDSIERSVKDLNLFGRQVPLSSQQQEDITNRTRDYLNRHFPNIIELAVLDLDGNEVTRVNQEQTFLPSQLTNRAEEPFFAVSRQGLGFQHVTGGYNGKPALQISVPARNGIGQVTGVVVAYLSVQSFEHNLASVPQDTGRSAFVINRQGDIVLGNAHETLQGVQDLRAWAASDSATVMLRGTDGKQVMGARAPILRSEWAVVIEQPTEIALFTSRRNTWILGLVLILTGILVGGWAVLLARELTRPIVQLRDGVQLLAAGKLGGTIAVEREDELGQLATEFNGMSERLAESQRAIELRNARLSEGLNLARIIQQDLLPHGPPSSTAIAANAACEPATEIGGDFYTYVPLPDGRVRLIIGDASGKGVAAALVMALTSSLVEVHARQAEGPSDLLQGLNAELYPRFSTSHMCVALLVAEFDPGTQQICVSNAGMIAPLVVAPDTCSYVPSYGPPLGVVSDIRYDETTIVLSPDQTIVFISDGIVEARNRVNEMWGFASLEATACEAALGGTAAIVSSVLTAIKEHVRDTPPADDMTIIAATLTPRLEEDNAYLMEPSARQLRPSR